MESHSCCDRSFIDGRYTSDSEVLLKQPHVDRLDTTKNAEFNSVCQDQTEEYFVAEDEAFLDAVSAALSQLAADCKTALRWSHDDADAEAAIQAAELSFCMIASVCKEAGIAVVTDLLDSKDELERCWDHGDYIAPSESSVKLSEEMWTNAERERTAIASPETMLHPPPAPMRTVAPAELQQRSAILSATEEIVEVELTDLLTQSHEEMLGLQRVFEERLGEAERTREAYELKHVEEMRSLQDEVAISRTAMDRIKQEIVDSTARKLEDMHSAITASQRAIEAGMQDQARYWVSICQELVAEKREMAQKVAEERGKYTALKAHLASHDDTNTKADSQGPGRLESSPDNDQVDKMRLCELSLSGNQGSNEASGGCTSSCSTPVDPSSRLVVVPSAESIIESSSAEVLPTHSSSSSNSSSSRTGKPTFRRYYLAQKRVVLH